MKLAGSFEDAVEVAEQNCKELPVRYKWRGSTESR